MLNRQADVGRIDPGQILGNAEVNED